VDPGSVGTDKTEFNYRLGRSFMKMYLGFRLAFVKAQ
jgi:hypothetical protein